MSTNELFLYGLLLTAAAGVFALRVLFLMSLARCLRRIHPNNRKLQPTLVWLDLVPVFNLVWGFVMVRRIADSLAAEFDDRTPRGASYGKGNGTAWMVCVVVAYVLGLLPFGLLPTILAVFLWVAYWREIAEYSGRLAEAGGDEHDDYDAE